MREKWKNRRNAIRYRVMRALSNEDGMTTVEIILIILVLIGLVIIFKSQLNDLVNDIFDKIVKQAKTI